MSKIETKAISRISDMRGYFSTIYRRDTWGLEVAIKQANVSFTYPGVVRAWHRHSRGQVDFFVPLDGAVRICMYDDVSEDLSEAIISSVAPAIVKVDGKYWHGIQVVGDKPLLLLYLTNNLYDIKNPDEERMVWNDVSVVPKSINGNEDDVRCGKVWDWYRPNNR